MIVNLTSGKDNIAHERKATITHLCMTFQVKVVQDSILNIETAVWCNFKVYNHFESPVVNFEHLAGCEPILKLFENLIQVL